MTASHGHQGNYGLAYRSEQLAHIENNRWDKAIEMDIDDIHGNFGTKYDKAIKEMLDHEKNEGRLTNAQHKRLKAKCK
ncbi:MAG: hypothetical protein IPP71_09520 [Bacteroidetes bacterium]|nr:hypothetical protein [Bacteroidota bacterium]